MTIVDDTLAELKQMVNKVKSLTISEREVQSTEGVGAVVDHHAIDYICAGIRELCQGSPSSTSPVANSTVHVGPTPTEKLEELPTPKITLTSPSPSPPTSPRPLLSPNPLVAVYGDTLPALLPPPDLTNTEDHYSPMLQFNGAPVPFYRAPAIRSTRSKRHDVSTPYSRGRSSGHHHHHHAESSRHHHHAEYSRRHRDSESSGAETSAPTTPELSYESEVHLLPTDFEISDPTLGNRHVGGDGLVPLHCHVVPPEWLEQFDPSPEFYEHEGKDAVDIPDGVFTLEDLGNGGYQGTGVEFGLEVQFLQPAPESGYEVEAGRYWDGDVNMGEDAYDLAEGYSTLSLPEPAYEPHHQAYPFTISVSIDVQVPTAYGNHTAAIRYICNSPDGVDERAVFLPGQWEELRKVGCQQALEKLKDWCLLNNLLPEGWDVALEEVRMGMVIHRTTMIGMLGTFGDCVEHIVSVSGPDVQFRLKQAPSALYAKQAQAQQGPRPSLDDGVPPVNIYHGDVNSLPEGLFSLGIADPPSAFRKRRSPRLSSAHAKTRAAAEAARREASASKTRSGRSYNLVDEGIERRRKLAPGIGVHYADEDEDQSIVGLIRSFKKARI